MSRTKQIATETHAALQAGHNVIITATNPGSRGVGLLYDLMAGLAHHEIAYTVINTPTLDSMDVRGLPFIGENDETKWSKGVLVQAFETDQVVIFDEAQAAAGNETGAFILKNAGRGRIVMIFRAGEGLAAFTDFPATVINFEVEASA